MSKRLEPEPPDFKNVARAALEQVKQIPKDQWWRDMLEILRKAPLTETDLKEAQDIIASRLKPKETT